MDIKTQARTTKWRLHLTIMAYGGLSVLCVCFVLFAMEVKTPNWLVYSALAIMAWGTLGLVATNDDRLRKAKDSDRLSDTNLTDYFVHGEQNHVNAKELADLLSSKTVSKLELRPVNGVGVFIDRICFEDGSSSLITDMGDPGIESIDNPDGSEYFIDRTNTK